MKKRLSALAILASILLIGCAADKGDAKTDETVGANTDSAVATEALTPEESVLKHLPEASYFNGENFNIGWSQQYDFNEVYFTRTCLHTCFDNRSLLYLGYTRWYGDKYSWLYQTERGNLTNQFTKHTLGHIAV